MTDELKPQEGAPICKCELDMSENPHPDAGKPFTLCEVGAVWVCIPCQSATLHKWCGRALDAEKKLTTPDARIATARNEALEEALEVVRKTTPNMPPDGPTCIEHAVVNDYLHSVFCDIRALQTPDRDTEGGS